MPNNKYLKLSIFISSTFILSACNATPPPAYQSDKSPEERTEYNGLKGVAQQQKDQSYLMDKELSDRCIEAKISLAIAESEKNKNETKHQQSIVKLVCAV